jgi:nitrogen fixation protein NifB
MSLDYSQHPCFNAESRHRTGRIHLPIAPKCNIQCNYCNRKYDCANESRPGVTTAVLSPMQALRYLDLVLEKNQTLRVVGIAGPGDPFAQPDKTLETFELVREKYPDMLLCVATNGLNLAPHIDKLAELQVSHVTLTINAVSPEIGADVYAWVRDGKKIYRGIPAAKLLYERQLEAIKELKKTSVVVKVNTIIVPGVNDFHIPEVAEEMRELGVDIMNCIPLYAVPGTPFETVEPPTAEDTRRLRSEVAEYLPQMSHCTRCRADAVGMLGQEASQEIVEILRNCSENIPEVTKETPYVAVASMEGLLVNQHLGEATSLWIYDLTMGYPTLIEQRKTPEPGSGDARWKQLAATLHDCHSLFVSGVGNKPREILEDAGMRVIEMSGLISDGTMSLMRTGAVPSYMRRPMRSCESGGCKGGGGGCA